MKFKLHLKMLNFGVLVLKLETLYYMFIVALGCNTVTLYLGTQFNTARYC